MRPFLYSKLLLLLSLVVSLPALALSVPVRVSPEWLSSQLGRPGLSIIEFSDEVSFAFDGHIPGSVVTYKSAWRQSTSDGSLVRLSVEELAEKIRDLGVDEGDGVVIYYKGQDTDEILGAVYLFWLFHLLGHTNVGMLDRGWLGWERMGGPVEEGNTDPEKGDFLARPLLALEIDTHELERIHAHYLLVDGRPATHFQGLDKFAANPRYGHIPGSLNQPWQDYMRRSEEGRHYIELPEVPALLKKLQIDRQRPLLLTCLGGTGSAFNYLAFYTAGYRNLRVDDAALRRWNSLRLPLVNTDLFQPVK